MPVLKPALAAAALVLLTACSAYTIRHDFDPTADFKGYRTFAWYAASRKAKGKAPDAHPLLDKRVRLSVEQQLQAKGFRLEAQADPDFLVAYYPIYQTRRYRTQTTVAVGGRGFYRPWGYGVGTRFSTSQTRSYREGTLVLEVVDQRSHELVWQGYAEGALTALDDPQEAQAQIDRAVRDLLDRFPPR